GRRPRQRGVAGLHRDRPPPPRGPRPQARLPQGTQDHVALGGLRPPRTPRTAGRRLRRPYFFVPPKLFLAPLGLRRRRGGSRGAEPPRVSMEARMLPLLLAYLRYDPLVRIHLGPLSISPHG